MKALYKSKHLPEIAGDAIWTVSSCKRGFGVKNLRDNDTNTYWQSDGGQPHKITCQFRYDVLIANTEIR